MRAITQTTYGDPSVLVATDVPEPSPLPGDVLVDVKATSVNPVDVAVRAGGFPILEPPFVLGWDLSGVVRSVVPPTAAAFRPGDEVFGMPLLPRAASTNAEVVAAPMSHLAPKPASLSHPEAAALALVGLTAWQGLVDIAEVQPGDRVLVHGGGGGVGHVAVQIAAARGAEVFATASAGKHDWLRSIGVAMPIDYATDDFVDAVVRAGGPVDVVFDTVGGGLADRSIEALRPDGLLVTIVDQFDEALQQRYHDAGRRLAGFVVAPDGAALRELGALVDAGRLRPHLEAVYPLDRLADAHAHVARGGLTGKVAVTV